MATFFLSEDDDPIDIRIDGVFKAVFAKGTPESTKALSKLVSALIGRELSIISILTNEPPIDNIRDRQIRFDINCKAENGELVDVEMCLNPDVSEPVRLEFYTAKLFGGQDIRGVDKDYGDLKRTYQIAILGNTQLFSDDSYYHTFFYYDPIRGISLDGRTQIITLELSKLKEIVEKPIGQMTASERWAVFLEYLTRRDKRDKINMIVEYEEGIAMASQVLMNVSKDEIERARLLSEYKYQMDMQSKLVTAKKEGKLEEKLERDKEELENARNALAKGYPLETIHDITGLDIETLKNLTPR